MHALLRRTVPLAVRWRLRAGLRRWHDWVRRVRFARRPGGALSHAYLVCRYTLPVQCYPGQEPHFESKRSNIALAMGALNGLEVAAGETFSFWRSVGRPTARRGYGFAAAIKDGVLTQDIGGALCLVSTLVYNALLLSGMTVRERYAHSVDSYGDARYFELGRDAAVEYPYRDLRGTNDATGALLLRVRMEGGLAVAEVMSRSAPERSVDVEAQVVGQADGRPLVVRTLRHIRDAAVARTQDLGLSVYRLPD